MAYQSKKHRKFVATSVTAALVATAVAPAAGFAAEFKDEVPAWAKDAVDYLIEKGAINGYEDGTFKPNAPIKRGEAAKILALALELDVDDNAKTEFEDAKDHWASKYIAAIQKHNENIINGYEGKFRPNDTITRQEMAKMIVTAYDLKLNEDADVSFTDNNGWGAEYVNILASLGIVEGVGNGKFDPNGAVTRAQTPVFVFRTEVPSERVEVPTKPVTTPEVVSVSADNNKQIVITLKGDINLDEAAKASNYTLKDSDGKTVKNFTVDVPNEEDVVKTADSSNTIDVTITLGDAADNQDVYTVTIGKKIIGTEVVEEVEFFDITIPEVKNVTVIGNDTIKVVFSEPIDAESAANNGKGSFTLEQDGSKLYIKKVEWVKNNTEANVEVYSTFDEGTLKVTVDNKLEDYAGLNLKNFSTEIDVVKDEDAPVVIGYKKASKTGVTLVFNEDIELVDDATADAFYHTNSKNTVDEDIDKDTDGNQLGAVVNGNELTLHFTENQLPSGTAYIYIDGETLKDKWDNLNKSQIRVEVKIEIDETKPEVKEVKATETKLEVTFSEKIDSDTIKKDNFALLDKDGKEVNKIRRVSAKGSDGVTIDFTEALSGKYSLVVKGIKDLAGNEIEKVTKEFEIKDTKPINFDEVTVTLVDETDDYYKLLVKYPEAMATEGKYSVTDLDNYAFGGTALSDLKGVDLEVVDNGTAVEITISRENNKDLTIEANKGMKITIARVADAAGNYTVEYSKDIEIVAPATISFTAKATAPKTLVLTFADIVDLDVSDFKVYNDEDGTEEVKISKVSTSILNGKTVATITLAEELAYDPETVGAYVDVIAQKTKNRYGVTVANVDVAITDEIKPEVKVLNKKPVVENTANNTFTIQFTEDLELTSASLAATDFVVTDEFGNTLVPDVDFKVTESADGVLEFELQDSYLEKLDLEDAVYVGTIDVALASNAKYVTDVKGNKLAAFDIEVKLAKID